MLTHTPEWSRSVMDKYRDKDFFVVVVFIEAMMGSTEVLLTSDCSFLGEKQEQCAVLIELSVNKLKAPQQRRRS